MADAEDMTTLTEKEYLKLIDHPNVKAEIEKVMNDPNSMKKVLLYVFKALNKENPQ